MTVREMMTQLAAERAQIDEALRTLAKIEQAQQVQPYPGRRRGRKGMGQEERAEVCRRMRAYWAAQRKARTA